MRIPAVQLGLGLVCISIALLMLAERVPQTGAIYPYTIKGYVQDVRHNPRLLIGGWFLYKAIKLKKLKLLFKLKKKLKLKFIAKKILLKFLIGRRKRSTDEIDLPGHVLPEIHENDILPYFSMASEFDTEGCLPKSICEAMARGNRSYHQNMFERTITEDLTVARPEDTSSPSFVYEYAAYYGRTMRDEQACSSLFSNCQQPPQQLKKFMDETFTSDICNGPDQLVPEGSVSSYSLFEDQDYRSLSVPIPTTASRRTSAGASSGGINFPRE